MPIETAKRPAFVGVSLRTVCQPSEVLIWITAGRFG